MRVLVLGGTGFIGTHVVSQLKDAGHEVLVFHRGTVPTPPGTWPILGDRHDLDSQRHLLRVTWPEVVIDLIAASGRQAAALMRVFRGVAGRVVVASSMDVYRAAAVLHRLDAGSLEPTPLTEASALRTTSETYPAPQLQRLQTVFPWLDERYDKLAVERAVANDPELPSTVLRLPMVYGPGDHLHRLRPLLVRMDEGRRATLSLPESLAAWRAPRGYVENVAAAVVLAATREEAVRRVYNVAEPGAMTELEWTERVARAAGWHGRVVSVPDASAPGPGVDANLAQHWDADSSRIRVELGYVEPVAQDEALRRTIAWERLTPFLPQDLEAFEEGGFEDRR